VTVIVSCTGQAWQAWHQLVICRHTGAGAQFANRAPLDIRVIGAVRRVLSCSVLSCVAAVMSSNLEILLA